MHLLATKNHFKYSPLGIFLSLITLHFHREFLFNTHNMNPLTSFVLLTLLLMAPFSASTRPEPTKAPSPPDQLKHPKDNHNSKGSGDGGGGSGYGSGVGGFFGPGGGFNIPGFGNGFGNGIAGGGYGAGYGSPNGGSSGNGVTRSSVVCKEKGPCYQKKVTCPAKCFYSYSGAGKGYGGGGGGGGCSIDCKKTCTATC